MLYVVLQKAATDKRFIIEGRTKKQALEMRIVRNFGDEARGAEQEAGREKEGSNGIYLWTGHVMVTSAYSPVSKKAHASQRSCYMHSYTSEEEHITLKQNAQEKKRR